MMNACYNIAVAPVGDVYRQSVEYGCAVGKRALLVVRDPDIDPGTSIASILEGLEPFLTRISRVREWPGTQLLLHEAALYEYAVSPALCAKLISLRPGLFEWLHPDAPEDLSFCREDGSPILVTTSHERDAYMFLTDDEKRRLDIGFPALSAALMREPTAGR